MPTSRIPLSWPYAERDNSTSKDSRRVNVIDEVSGQTVYTLKRPGMIAATGVVGAGPGQGLVEYHQTIYAVIDDTLLSAITPANSGTDGTSWSDLGAGPWAPRYGHQAVAIGQTIYLMGGLVSTTGEGAIPVPYDLPSNDVWALSIDGAWKQCTGSAPWTGRAYFSAGVLNGRIYIMGGTDTAGTVYGDVWSTNDGTNWVLETAAAGWGAREGATLIANQTGFYLMGGANATSSFNDVWFSADGASWSAITENATWTGRSLAAGFFYHNTFYIAGGFSRTGFPINQIYSSPDAKNWTFINTGSFPGGGLYNAGFCVYSNRMWLVNGISAGGFSVNRVLSSVDGATWTLVTTGGPFAESNSGALVAAPSVGVVNDNAAQTMYWLGGRQDNGTFTNHVFFGVINASLTTATSLDVSTVHQPFQFASFVEGSSLLIKNQSDLFVLSGANVFKVTDSGYPINTVPGIVVLGTFAYVMDRTGLIRNCSEDDPFHWPFINALGADYEDDPGVALAKYLNYLIAFGTYTTQTFYDSGAGENGNPAGSHLKPYLNANLKVGCAAAATVCNVGPNLVWVSQTAELNRQVMTFNGLSPVVISTPFIDKLLKDSSTVTLQANSVSIPGHSFYVLNMGTGRTTSFAYDFTTRNWYEWSRIISAAEVPWIFPATVASIEGTGHSYVLNGDDGGIANGSILEVTPSAYDDVGATFPVDIITGKVDAQNIKRKYLDQVTVIGDQTTGSLYIAITYDDYQTYGTALPVDLSTNRPALFRKGAFRRAAFKCTKSDSHPMRLEALELEVSQGT